jgi:hypothetical protein
MKTPSNVNAKWHKAHPAPKTSDDIELRIQWTLEHFKNCQCRKDISPVMKKEMQKRGIVVPV